MLQALVAALIIVVVLAGWLGVQHLARRFALRHPEYGPPRGQDSGCASSDSGCEACGLVKNDCPSPNLPSK